MATTARPAATKAARRAPVAMEDDDDLPGDDEAADDDGAPAPAASPYVRKVAHDLGLKLSRVRGSGAGGRVQLEDLARYIAKLEHKVARAGRYAEEPQGLHFPLVGTDFSVFGPVVSEPLSPLRKIIASRMVENKVTIPHVTQFDEADLTVIESLRAKYKAAYEKAGAKLSPTPFLIKALVTALKAHPRFNASLNEVAETLVLKQYYHLWIAVDTEAGLLVPVLKDADKKSLLQIAKELGEISEKARDRKLTASGKRGRISILSPTTAGFLTVLPKPKMATSGLLTMGVK